MRYTEIAIAKPFEGAPMINIADVFGASAEKPLLLKIPVTGERPIQYSALGLPAGLLLENGIISGRVAKEGAYPITLIAENRLGKAEKKLTLEIKNDTVLLTPLLGFTSWNAFGSAVSQEKILHAAQKIHELGISEYGYSFINVDSGWQKEYGGEFDAIMPNEKFPDMKEMCDKIHTLGLKCGIYSTPMLTAWGCPDEFESIPGCTVGEADICYPDTNGGIGVIHKEENNAKQWAHWGFDYLKYDWSPCDPVNAELMRKALIATDRDFGYCVTVTAQHCHHRYWEKYCNSYRCNADSSGKWENLLGVYRTYFDFIDCINKGHYFDLDMLDVGHCVSAHTFNKYTEDEQLVSYSVRAFLGSPIQISSDLDKIDEFELSMYCNEEIIAINQDSAFSAAKPYIMLENGKKIIHVFRKVLSDGGYALAAFNMGETAENVNIYLDKTATVRDVWAKKDIGQMDTVNISMPPHTVRIFKVKKA